MQSAEPNDPIPAVPPIRHVLETVLYCEDLAAARRFYEGVLELHVHAYDADRRLHMRLADSMLLLFRASATRNQTVTIDGAAIPPHGADGAGHVAFRVAESTIAGWKQHFASHGVPIESEVRWPGGGHSIYVRDPAGNSVELATASIWGLPESSNERANAT